MPDSLEALLLGPPKSAGYKAVLLPAGYGLFLNHRGASSTRKVLKERGQVL